MKLAVFAFVLSLGLAAAQPPAEKPKPASKPELTVERTDTPEWPGDPKVVTQQPAVRWEYAMMIGEANKSTWIYPPRAVDPIAGGRLVEELNRAGAAGWEAFGTTSLQPGRLTILLKRPLR